MTTRVLIILIISISYHVCFAGEREAYHNCRDSVSAVQYENCTMDPWYIRGRALALKQEQIANALLDSLLDSFSQTDKESLRKIAILKDKGERNKAIREWEMNPDSLPAKLKRLKDSDWEARDKNGYKELTSSITDVFFNDEANKKLNNVSLFILICSFTKDKSLSLGHFGGCASAKIVAGAYGVIEKNVGRYSRITHLDKDGIKETESANGCELTISVDDNMRRTASKLCFSNRKKAPPYGKDHNREKNFRGMYVGDTYSGESDFNHSLVIYPYSPVSERISRQRAVKK